MKTTDMSDVRGVPNSWLTAVSRAGSNKRGLATWLCVCDCGKTKVVAGTDLRSGNVISCGCRKTKGSAEKRLTHGMSYTKTYAVWATMRQRCENPKNDRYAFYGSRGIRVCDRWKSFTNFLADMGEKPDGMTIERRNNDGNYEPGNCYWANRKQQARNRRSNTLLTFRGKTRCLAEWAEILGINQFRISERIRAGWSVERALTVPPRLVADVPPERLTQKEAPCD